MYKSITDKQDKQYIQDNQDKRYKQDKQDKQDKSYKQGNQALLPANPDKYIRVAGITRESVADGPGVCAVLFVQGCCRQCSECHNPESRTLTGGVEMSVSEVLTELCASPGLQGVVFSGGEPFLQASALAELGSYVREKGLQVIVYTGFTIEELIDGHLPDKAPLPGDGSEHKKFAGDRPENGEPAGIPGNARRLLDVADILVDGPYIKEQRDPRLPFRGSRNQRILNVKESLKQGQAILINK